MFALLYGLHSVSPEELRQMLDREHPVVVDVNSPLSWSTSRVPGAINLDPLTYAESQLPADKTTAIVFYCSNLLCRKAPNAARRARQMGYENIHVMSAGITGWMKAALPTESGR